MSKVLLITGATGKQGGAVVDAILALPSATSEYTILAVTRDTNSSSAQKLAAKSSAIKLVQGNLDDVPGLFRTAAEVTKQPIWGVYSVQISLGKGVTTEGEERQGMSLIDESIKHGVKHFVYSSVERGGDEKSWTNPTPVPHFITKYHIEHHLRDAAAGDKMGWTVLRPVAFMENLQPGFPTKVFMTALRNTLGDNAKSLQFVATEDIGFFAAQAFAKPQEFNHKAIGLAGDDVTVAALSKAFQNTTGAPLPTTFWPFGSALMWAVKEVGTMVTWFKTDGYAADIPMLRKMNPGLMDFEAWLVQKRNFVTTK